MSGDVWGIDERDSAHLDMTKSCHVTRWYARRHVTHVIVTWHKIRACHTFMTGACHTYGRVMSHNSFICEGARHTYKGGMARDSFICEGARRTCVGVTPHS